MKAGFLTPLGPCCWDELAAIDVDEWLWCDTAHPGIHVVNQLPTRPADVTHVWGWATDRWARARVDHGLPGGGVVGAVLHVDSSVGGKPCRFTEQAAPLWSPADGRANRERQDGSLDLDVSGGRRDAVLRNVTIAMKAEDSSLTFIPLTFLELLS